MPIRYGSVCSGIEAATVAWHGLGWEPAWFSEIEPFPCHLLATRFPEVPNLGDMTSIADRVLRKEAEAPDILCGGTPCQAFSTAGKRLSLQDDRGNLSLQFVRLADAIDTVRRLRGQAPLVVFYENVPGILSTKDNAFGHLLAGLAGEDVPLEPPGGRWANAGAVSGPIRNVAWRVLDAQFFGVPQRRRRVFVVAGAGDRFNPAAVLFEREGVSGHPAARGPARPGPASDAAGGAGSDGGMPRVAKAVRTKSGGVDREDMHTLIPAQVSAYQCHGNNVGPMGVVRAGRGDVQSGVPFLPVVQPATGGLKRSRPGSGGLLGPDDVADPLSASEGKTYTHEGCTLRMHNVVQGFYATDGFCNNFPPIGKSPP